MQQGLKQRLVGALVILALVVIFLPMVLEGPVERQRVDVPIRVPSEPSVPEGNTLPPPDFLDQPAPGTAGDGGGGGSADGPDESGAGSTADAEGVRPSAASGDRDEDTDDRGSAASGQASETVDDGGSDEAASGEQQPPDARPGSWTVQVGAFSDPGNAERMRQRLTEAGFEDVYSDVSDRDGEALHRVRLGPVATRAEAERIAQRVASSMDIEGILVPR